MYYKDNKIYLTSYDVKEAVNKIVNETKWNRRLKADDLDFQYSSYDKNDKEVKDGFSG